MDRKTWTLIAVCVATFMLLLDITIVNVALPSIAASLHASFSQLQWVIDAYALMLAALLLTAGSLADLFGRRLVFAAGLVLFTVASLGCGLAGSATVLDLARGVQGIGGAMMFATSLALLAQEFHGRDRGFAFGVWGATTGGAVAIGPLLGGVLTESWGWESIFFINVPIGVLAVALTMTKLGESRDAHARGVDWAGVLTFSAALFLLVFALIRGNAEGWGSTTIVALLVGAVVLLAVFVWAEWRQERPMLDLALFRKPSFVGAAVVAFAISASIFALFLYLTLYMQDILGYGPLDAGLRFLPVSLLSFAIAPIAGRLSAHMPVRWLMGGGLTLIAIGLALMHGLTVSDGWTALLAGLLCAGAGVGLVNPPLASTAVSVVPPARSGMASGINSTARQVGIATGVAGLGAIFTGKVQSQATALLGHVQGLPHDAAAHLGAAAANGSVAQALERVPPHARAGATRAAHQAFISGLNAILLIGAAIAFAGAIAAAVLTHGRDFVPAQGEHTSADAPSPTAGGAIGEV